MRNRSSPEAKEKATGLISLSTLSETQRVDKKKKEKKSWIRNLEVFFVTNLLEAKFGSISENGVQLHLGC